MITTKGWIKLKHHHSVHTKEAVTLSQFLQLDPHDEELYHPQKCVTWYDALGCIQEMNFFDVAKETEKALSMYDILVDLIDTHDKRIEHNNTQKRLQESFKGT